MPDMLKVSRIAVPAIAVCALGCGVLLSGCHGREDAASRVDFGSCLSELTNQIAIATAPLGKMDLVSSFDRSGGNADWLPALAAPRATVADLRGPGVLRRFWIAGMEDEQRLAFFFDNEKIPRINLSVAEVFDGQHAPFVRPLCDVASNGRYCYVPLPYAKRLRIELSAPQGDDARAYFQFSCERLPNHVRVASFPPVLPGEHHARLKEIADAWTQCGRQQALALESCGDGPVQTVAPTASATVLDLEQSGIVDCLALRLEADSPTGGAPAPELLAACVLSCYWDGCARPSINVPLGDFFASGRGVRPFASMYLGSDGVWLISRLPMPFRQKMRCTLQNNTLQSLRVRSRYRLSAAGAATRHLRYLHAAYQEAYGSKEGKPFPVCELAGRGHYVGCSLRVFGADSTWDILEGDDRTEILGWRRRILKGTGLEDYFNGAFYYGDLFARPLHGLNFKAAMNTAQYRFHLPDRIGYEDGLRMTFEFGPQNMTPGKMASVAWWYQDEPGAVAFPAVTDELKLKRFLEMDGATAMSGLMELERAGAMPLGEQVCSGLGERLGGSEWGQLFDLRRLSYAAQSGGWPSVRTKVEYLCRSPVADVAEQARHLTWLYGDGTNRALLTLSANADCTIFLDGRELLRNASWSHMAAVRLWIDDESHELAVEAKAVRNDPWIIIGVMVPGASYSLTGGNTWQYTVTRSLAWPGRGADEKDLRWQDVSTASRILPLMSSWCFTPNAYVYAQTHAGITRLGSAWHTNGAPAYLRCSFRFADLWTSASRATGGGLSRQ